MPKGWDIVGVRRKKSSPPPAAKRKSKNSCLFIFFLLIVFLGVAFYFGSLNSDFLFKPKPSIHPSTTASSRPKTEDIKLEILNGSGRFEEIDKVSLLVTKAGYKIAKTENSINMYDKTIVYYQRGYEKDAQTLVKALLGYGATAQVFTNSSSYNLAVVIGTR